MTDYVWKHLPYAIYIDTNALRSAGANLEAPWINELLSITNEYGISVCISELVLSEWCEHIMEVLESNRQKLLSSTALLNHYSISVPNTKQDEISLPSRSQLVKMVTDMMKAAGFTVISNWEAPLSRLLNEAVAKRPPFEPGGKGLCDAVIIESYAEHAKKNFTKGRVIVISKDSAVKRSATRFSDRGIVVDFVGEFEIVDTLKSLLNDEVAAYIETRKEKLKAYILKRESEIIDFVKRAQVEITDWTINPPFGKQKDQIFGNVKSILAVRPVRISDVIGGAPVYGEEIAENRYPVIISVEIELEIIVIEPGLRLRDVYGPRARVTVQPDMLDNKSPVNLKEEIYDWKPIDTVKTIRRDFTVFATLDAKKVEDGIFEDLRLEKVY